MKTSSAKAKGRRLQNLLRTEILRVFPELSADDVKCAVMGESGDDIHCSPKARGYFPFSSECKNTERLNVWDAIRQVSERARYLPLVVFARNRQIPWVALSLDALLNILRQRANLLLENARLRRELDDARSTGTRYTPASPLD